MSRIIPQKSTRKQGARIAVCMAAMFGVWVFPYTIGERAFWPTAALSGVAGFLVMYFYVASNRFDRRI
jgi:hypothetical protein